MAADLSNKPLDRLLAPFSHPLLQGVELPQAVTSGIASPELDKKLERGLVGIFLKVVRHFLPMVFEDVRTSATRFVADPPVSLRADDYAARASVLRQRLTRRRSVLYCLTANRPGNWKQSSSKSCIALMLGSASRRRNTIGPTVRSAWMRALLDWA